MLDSGSMWGPDKDTSEEGSAHGCPEGRMGGGSEASCWNTSLEKMWEAPHGQVLEGTRSQGRGTSAN